MKTLEEYQKELKLFDFEMPHFKEFLEDPKRISSCKKNGGKK